MGGWCSYKTAQLLCRPGPPARSGRSQAFPPSHRPEVPEGPQACPARPPGGAAPAARPTLSRGPAGADGGGHARRGGCPAGSASGAGFTPTTSWASVVGGAGGSQERLPEAGAEGPAAQRISRRRGRPSQMAVKWPGKESGTTTRCSQAGDTTAGGTGAQTLCLHTGLESWR